ncbi:50S ribosomal protein L33 [Patescibacteria group bacterium]|nr:50S ribosomal protein L33 [Patescibacteria group bacterium]
MAKAKTTFVKSLCSDCKKVNYYLHKSKTAMEKKLELKKFCNACRKHTLHVEGKK